MNEIEKSKKMNKTTVDDVIRKANEAGYDTNLVGIKEPFPLYGGGMTEKDIYFSGKAGKQNGNFLKVNSKKEYNVFKKIIADKKKKEFFSKIEII